MIVWWVQNARLLWMMSDVHSDLIEAPLSEEDQFEKFQSQVYETLKGHFGTDREKGGVQLELASLKLCLLNVFFSSDRRSLFFFFIS